MKVGAAKDVPIFPIPAFRRQRGKEEQTVNRVSSEILGIRTRSRRLFKWCGLGSVGWARRPNVRLGDVGVCAVAPAGAQGASGGRELFPVFPDILLDEAEKRSMLYVLMRNGRG
jgi:hypothetical protein